MRFCRECGAPQLESISGYKHEKVNSRFNDRGKYKNPDKLIFPGTKRKSPLLAAFLSFILGGLGQIYLGQTNFGIMIVIIDIVVGLFGTVGIGYVIIMVVSVMWAYRDAQKLNKGEPILKWPRFGGKVN